MIDASVAERMTLDVIRTQDYEFSLQRDKIYNSVLGVIEDEVKEKAQKGEYFVLIDLLKLIKNVIRMFLIFITT